jgi:hypothetical protein
MLKKFSVIAAAAVATVAVAACGGYDPTAAADDYANTINSQWETYYTDKGLTSSEAASAGVTFTCPDNVQKDEAFTCTLEGKNSGESVDVQMEVNDSDVLVPANDTDYNDAVTQIDAAEAAGITVSAN